MKQIIDLFSIHKNLALFLVAASAGILGFAYISQYVFHYDPCVLCLYQRKPYFVVIALSLLVVALHNKRPALSFPLLLLCALCFVVGASVAGFHVGVESGWWKGLQACANATMPENVSIDELREYLTNRKIVNCEVPTWKLFGLSMTAYNFFASVALALVTFVFAVRGRK